MLVKDAIKLLRKYKPTEEIGIAWWDRQLVETNVGKLTDEQWDAVVSYIMDRDWSDVNDEIQDSL